MIAESGVDERGAVESIDDVREFGEESVTGGECVVEAALADENEDGVGEVVEAVVVVEDESVRWWRGRTLRRLRLGLAKAADLEFLAAATGTGGVPGGGHEVDDGAVRL